MTKKKTRIIKGWKYNKGGFIAGIPARDISMKEAKERELVAAIKSAKTRYTPYYEEGE